MADPWGEVRVNEGCRNSVRKSDVNRGDNGGRGDRMARADGKVSLKLLTVPEAAEVLSVSVRTCWRLISTGELELVSIGRCARVTVASVEELIERGGTQ